MFIVKIKKKKLNTRLIKLANFFFFNGGVSEEASASVFKMAADRQLKRVLSSPAAVSFSDPARSRCWRKVSKYAPFKSDKKSDEVGKVEDDNGQTELDGGQQRVTPPPSPAKGDTLTQESKVPPPVKTRSRSPSVGRRPRSCDVSPIMLGLSVSELIALRDNNSVVPPTTIGLSPTTPATTTATAIGGPNSVAVATAVAAAVSSYDGKEIQKPPPVTKPTKAVKNSKLQKSKTLSVSSPVMSPMRPIIPILDPDDENSIPSLRSTHSRNKKFHRIFIQQVPDEERVLNYFACALIADILLQGHLYITENYFGFYSNVFGHVTKILIPINSVVKISKEKTAKIIPNAVGITTDECRHVFGSLLSRETTFRLLQKVWKRAINMEINRRGDLPDSGDENSSPGPDPLCDKDDDSGSNDTNVPGIIGLNGSSLDSTCSSFTGTTDSPSPPQIPLPDKSMKRGVVQTCLHKISLFIPIKRFSGAVKHVVVNFSSLPRATIFLLISTVLLVFLFLSAAFLLYRLNSLQHQISRFSFDPKDFEMEWFQERFRWQHQLHSTTVGHLKDALNLHVQQLVQVRKSLETFMQMVSDDATTYAEENNQSSVS